MASHPERDVMGLMLTTNAALVADVLRSRDQPDSEAVVRALAATRSLAVIVDDTLRSLVHQARAQGRTWAEIGSLLGVTRQAAFQRFGTGAVGPSGGADGPSGSADAAIGRDQPNAAAASAQTAQTAETAETGRTAQADLEAFLDGRFDTMRERFDGRMREACSVGVLRSLRESLHDQFGDVQARSAPRLHAHASYTVADLPVAFERGDRTVRIVVDADGQIAGLFLLDGR